MASLNPSFSLIRPDSGRFLTQNWSKLVTSIFPLQSDRRQNEVAGGSGVGFAPDCPVRFSLRVEDLNHPAFLSCSPSGMRGGIAGSLEQPPGLLPPRQTRATIHSTAESGWCSGSPCYPFFQDRLQPGIAEKNGGIPPTGKIHLAGGHLCPLLLVQRERHHLQIEKAVVEFRAD